MAGKRVIPPNKQDIKGISDKITVPEKPDEDCPKYLEDDCSYMPNDCFAVSYLDEKKIAESFGYVFKP